MSLRLPKPPYFEVGVKNYLYGDDVLKLALAAEIASKQYDIDVLFIAPYADIRRVRANTRRLFVLSPYMDLLEPGRGLADVLPESIKAAGADGVVLNHSEKPISLGQLRQSIERARRLELISFVCADTISEAQAVAHFHPDIINPEPSERIGKAADEIDLEFVKESIRAIKEIDSNILVEQAAGISNGQMVYDLIYAGAEATGAASGICCAPDPCRMLDEMVRMTRKAADDRERIQMIKRDTAI
ncbi:MAG: triose-phosphate isomerase [Eubacterium sp.]|nr:triose-phosphate isomerase [Eubacterium sp.]MBQ9062446.1 triose-phosphate isomerase [Eubacterium sp.]